MKRYAPKLKILPMSFQAEALRKYRDTISVVVGGPCVLLWRGRVMPAEYTDAYEIEVNYRTDTSLVPRPKVFVTRPLLQSRDGVGCPHRHGDQEPCVYYHPGNEWRPDMLLAHTIVPWASRWLYFYEIWLATGQWMGGGIPHEPKVPLRRAL